MEMLTDPEVERRERQHDNTYAQWFPNRGRAESYPAATERARENLKKKKKKEKRN